MGKYKTVNGQIFEVDDDWLGSLPDERRELIFAEL
jgi:hypothetical protein